MNAQTWRMLTAIVILSGCLVYMTRDNWQPAIAEWWGKTKHAAEETPPEFQAKPDEVGKEKAVRRIQVLQADRFDIIFADDARILGKLKVRAVPEAKGKVLSLLSRCESPSAILLERSDPEWIVEIKAILDGKQFQLSSWLKDNKLVYLE